MPNAKEAYIRVTSFRSLETQLLQSSKVDRWEEVGWMCAPLMQMPILASFCFCIAGNRILDEMDH